MGGSSIVGLVLLVATLSACSPSKRLARIIHRHPELKTWDTLTVQDTFISNEVKTDTVLLTSELLDTVYITKDKLKIKTILKDNKIYIEGKCESDTIVKEIKVPFETIKLIEPTFWQQNKWWIILLGATLIGLGIKKKLGL